ncbi:hypothetical protein ACFPPA_17445 [Rhodanobacter ginsengisoli]|uniref:Energy transducer TonB n=1 Tax=Rhodanobacter ginsengisoli TaxID=418646 RepID=A0ABW0QSN4_9GAMM
MTQERMARHSGTVRTAAWRDALYRGAILGLVAGCHLAALVLLLSHWPQGRATPRVRERDDPDATRLRLILLPSAPVARTAAAPPLQPRHLPLPARRSARVLPHAPPLAATSGVSPLQQVQPTVPDYRPGDFQARLRDARRPSLPRLPGSDLPRVAGLRLRPVSSTQTFVQRLTASTRCSAEYFKMHASANQFVTAQLMDRALEADGCGPHTDTSAASESIDAITRRITGDP